MLVLVLVLVLFAVVVVAVAAVVVAVAVRFQAKLNIARSMAILPAANDRLYVDVILILPA